MNPNALIEEHFKLKDWLEAESKRFAEYVKPVQARMEEVNNLLLAFLNETKQDAAKTDQGTAYRSVIVSPKIDDRDAYLDFIEQHWDTYGNAMLQLMAPKKEALKDFSDANEGRLPPGVSTSSFTRVNVRRA